MLKRRRSGALYARFCNSTCAESFAEDRRAGAIYPAFNTPDGAYSVERWSLVNGTCCYCGATVVVNPRIDLPPDWPNKEAAHA